MLIIGCDFHTRYQQIAMAREETSELLVERRLDHESGEAHAFYWSLQSAHEPVRVGIEATGPIHWFERLLAELGHELWIGDSGKIRASEVRKPGADFGPGAFQLFVHTFPQILESHSEMLGARGDSSAPTASRFHCLSLSTVSRREREADSSRPREERFIAQRTRDGAAVLSAQADRLAGARREEKADLLRSE
jgi:hypothetical protein